MSGGNSPLLAHLKRLADFPAPWHLEATAAKHKLLQTVRPTCLDTQGVRSLQCLANCLYIKRNEDRDGGGGVENEAR